MPGAVRDRENRSRELPTSGKTSPGNYLPLGKPLPGSTSGKTSPGNYSVVFSVKEGRSRSRSTSARCVPAPESSVPRNCSNPLINTYWLRMSISLGKTSKWEKLDFWAHLCVCTVDSYASLWKGGINFFCFIIVNVIKAMIFYLGMYWWIIWILVLLGRYSILCCTQHPDEKWIYCQPACVCGLCFSFDMWHMMMSLTPKLMLQCSMDLYCMAFLIVLFTKN